MLNAATLIPGRCCDSYSFRLPLIAELSFFGATFWIEHDFLPTEPKGQKLSKPAAVALSV